MANYVEKEVLYEEIVRWQDARAVAIEAGEEPPVMTDMIARAIMETAYGLGNRWNFKDYSWVDEMILDGIEAGMKAVAKFDRNHPKKNPFGFISFVIWRAFVIRIRSEKDFQAFKMELLLDETIDAFTKICDGEYDHVAEQAFFMCGGLDDVDAKWAEIQKNS